MVRQSIKNRLPSLNSEESEHEEEIQEQNQEEQYHEDSDLIE